MEMQGKVSALAKVGDFLGKFLTTDEAGYSAQQKDFAEILQRSEIENPWFTQQNLRFALNSWAELLNEENLNNWLENYEFRNHGKRVGLILAGNIPMVGFHDVICVILSGNFPLIKLSSKDRLLIPFLLKLWQEFSEGDVQFEIVEKLQDFDAVIATGSNNTARYLEFYFKDKPRIIRKNRTSVAVLSGEETDADLQNLAGDIFQYFGMGCRNVTRLFLPKSFEINRLFENFMPFGHIINHHKYANNYDYNKAIFLLNRDDFWDNNFVMLREEAGLFSPISVLNFSRYENLQEVEEFITENETDIQAVVSNFQLTIPMVKFGEAQQPSLETYADNVDTMRFLAGLD
ncbi:Acyl-CoA reductase (LuxC) [Cruoricaptor ignavus]|uniref:Acyl-CoA reductase (LuxC) n=1 Tax=Cruoricaptor ignavus TaxID=1118202 RepID=A0A1M6BYV2_9FLAO|nr:acyl-CoA reductase [Cruoricaptor ignavus]SHI53969.1 Acyl-CoA reductase (LuxC) [Cruoricaptor ignavus]